MKLSTSEILVLGLAGIAVYLIWRSQSATRVNRPADTGRPLDWVDEIFDSAGKSFTNGWRYFENGVAIDPSGNYYQNGAMVWQAPGAGA